MLTRKQLKIVLSLKVSNKLIKTTSQKISSVSYMKSKQTA